MIDSLLKNTNDTKEKLQLLALYFYYIKGAHNTTFQSLADYLGISQAAIYKHYRSKDELLVASINYAATKGREFIASGENHNLPALDRLKYYLKRNIDFCTDERIYSVAVITLHYFAICIPEVKLLHEEINKTRILKIENYLSQAKNEKVLGNINIKETATIIHSLLMGEMIKAYVWPDDKTVNLRLKNFWKAVILLIDVSEDQR